MISPLRRTFSAYTASYVRIRRYMPCVRFSSFAILHTAIVRYARQNASSFAIVLPKAGICPLNSRTAAMNFSAPLTPDRPSSASAMERTPESVTSSSPSGALSPHMAAFCPHAAASPQSRYSGCHFSMKSEKRSKKHLAPEFPNARLNASRKTALASSD